MRGLVKSILIVMVGSFFCAIGVIYSLWDIVHHDLCPELFLSGSVVISGVIIIVSGMKFQEIEIYIRDLLKGKETE